ncbi:hypothetical protein [Neptunomonas sp.]|uniref:hypothetical protein n=1 Tax=Neptunomonas sp. TaxID=1971898 RepID=UPI00356295BF
MNVSPITSWEGVEAYFTFADNPTAMAIILGLSVVVTVGAVIATIIHENETYIDYR